MRYESLTKATTPPIRTPREPLWVKSAGVLIGAIFWGMLFYALFYPQG